jgi:hypothetical protein
MSPSEDQLRAALHHGEGEHLDVDGLLLRAAATRHARRVRIGATVAAVLAVAGIGLGSVVAFGDRGGQPTAGAGSSRGAAIDLRPSNSLPAVPGASGSASGSAPTGPQRSSTACPPVLPQIAIPAGEPTAAAHGPLFAQPVAAVTVCAYFSVTRGPVTAGGATVSVQLTGGPAAALAASLEHASTTRLEGGLCPDMIALSARALAVFGVTADGTALRPVLISIDRPYSCNPPVTNGVAVRFNWVPDPVLGPYLAKLQQTTVQPGGVPGRNSGSPPR